ncbi:glycosyltransferase [Sphingobacterium gobiense]|uniref:Glycosyl transferase family 2 n=1 Tax=Sphingobacterium gobiense TaxID=1382456 RepID=A0A2S9JMV3_9SPHI|nr:glycosyltransferase [Sphingobacterium gobiense]PRD54426.1 glycosyl transferase family 2 [Sphingobacterium gobiense]
MSLERGINILGYINKQFGLGEGVRSNIRSISSTGIPYVLNDFKEKISPDIKDENTDGLVITEENPYDINLIQINVDNFERLLNSNGASYFAGKYNIGFWAWELELFPSSYQKYIDLLDEIWVPSNFCLNAISQISNKPVLRFMHSIDIPENDITRNDLGLPADKLIYLTIFDYHSSLHRKNPYAVIKAFEDAFGDDHSKLLVLKASIGVEYPNAKNELYSYIENKKNIMLIEDILPREKLYGLINNCDVFVSMHRSEGFGLTMAEAMYLGKPVIATAYSGNTEFMSAFNSVLIPYTLIPTGDNYMYSDLNNYWADVDINEVSLALKRLGESPSERKKLGDSAKKHIKDLLSPKTVGKGMKSRIDYIYDICLPRREKDLQETLSELTIENINLKRKVDALKQIKMVKWKLAFKNLKNKLFKRNRKYIWED